MRTDLTSNLSTETQRTGRAPVQLLEFAFPTAGTVRVSDRELGPADGLTSNWSALVEDWGALEDVVGSDPSEVTIEARQMTVTLINRGERPFSDYFLKEDPETVEVSLYQWFEGLTQDDLLLLDRFVIADPIHFSERSRLVSLDLVSVVAFFENTVGELLSAADFPNAKTDDVGRALDLHFGAVGRVATLCAKSAPEASLNGSVLSGTMTLAVHEDLDSLGFASSGKLQIGEELVRYGSRTSSQFNLNQRGCSPTAAAEHLDRERVVQWITDHTYLTGKGPVASISAVQVGGYPAPSGIYSVQAGSNPARILFTEKPYAIRYAAGSSFLQMQFDATGADNTAVQAYKAYDSGDDATAARIDESHRTLSLKQATINPDRGAVVKAYLAVEHWESDTIVNDFAEVWVEGIGTVGRLSRPNAAEGIAIDADVDIDHGHSHAIGSEHVHNFHDPTLATSETAHTHTTNNAGTTTTYFPPTGDIVLSAPPEEGKAGEFQAVTFTDAPTSFDGAIVHFRVHLGGCRLNVTGPSYFTYWAAPGDNSISFPARSSNFNFVYGFKAYGTGAWGAQCRIYNVSMDVLVNTEVQAAQTGANTQVAISGSNDPVASDKHPSDVDDLSTNNVGINVTSTQASTRSHVNLFDLTSAVAFDWSWFNDRDVKVTYRGSTDNQSIYILHMFFDVEYRPRERFYSDDVTAEVIGLLDDAGGSVTGTAAGAITRPDHVVRYLLQVCGNLPAARFDTSSYAAAGARLQSKAYTVDGALPGDLTVKEALRKTALQTRLRPFFSAGLSKLRFVEALADWGTDDGITASEYQLRSIAIERQPLSSVINQVDLFYARDLTSAEDGPAGYAASVRAADSDSVSRFGVRADAARFLFDLVGGAAMAQDLASFYAARLAWPSSFFRLNCYLEKLHLEKEDKVELTASFGKLRKAKMRVLSAGRTFGSGKNSLINHVQLLLEALRYILIEHEETDALRILDSLDVSVGLEGDLSDLVDFTDLLILAVGAALEDTITFSDALEVVADFGPTEEESITLSDALGHGIGIGIEDNLNLLDDVEGWRQFGYGGGEYGFIGWGGFIIWSNRAPDELALFDELFIDLVQGPLTETLTIEDALYISSGYGCPLGTGWGLTPWGD